MEIDPANLPEDAAALQALVRQLLGAVKSQGLKIAQLEARIAKLKRMQFGQATARACWSADFGSTKRIVGRSAASTIASASAASFFCRFRKGLT